jgi:hypothetical protein
VDKHASDCDVVFGVDELILLIGKHNSLIFVQPNQLNGMALSAGNQ